MAEQTISGILKQVLEGIESKDTKEAIQNKLKLNDTEFTKLLKYISQLSGLDPGDFENLKNFFERAAEVIDKELDDLDKELLKEEEVEGDTVPERIKDFVKAKEEFDEQQAKQLAQIRKRLEKHGIPPSEVDAFIYRLLEKRLKFLREQGVPEDEIIALAMESLSSDPKKVRQAERQAEAKIQKLRMGIKSAHTAPGAQPPTPKPLHLETRNKIDTAVEALIQSWKNPDPKLPNPVPNSLLQRMSPETKKRLARVVIANTVNTVDPITKKPDFTAAETISIPPIAMILDNAKIKLETPEEQKIITELYASAKRALTIASQEIASEKLQPLAKEEARQVVEQHLLNIGLTPEQIAENSDGVGVMANFMFHTTTPITAFQRAVIHNPVDPNKESLLEIAGALPYDPITVLDRLSTPGNLNTMFLGIAQISHNPNLEEEMRGWAKLFQLISQTQQYKITPAIQHTNTYYGEQEGYGNITINDPFYKLQQGYYKIKSFAEPVIAPIRKAAKNRITNWIKNTAVGKSVKKVIAKLDKKAATWVLKQAAKKGLKLGIEKGTEVGLKLAVGTTIKAAVASALGISTFGAGLLLLAAWEIGTRLPGWIAKLGDKLGLKAIADHVDLLGIGSWFERKIKKIPDLLGIGTFFRGVLLLGNRFATIVNNFSIFVGIPLAAILIGIFAVITFIVVLPQNIYNQTLMPQLERTGEVPPGSYTPADTILGENCSDTAACVAFEFLRQNGYSSINEQNYLAAMALMRAWENPPLILNVAYFTSIVEANVRYMSNVHDQYGYDQGYLMCIGFSLAVDPNLNFNGWANLYAGNVPSCNHLMCKDAGIGDHIVYPELNGHYHIAELTTLRADRSFVITQANGGGHGELDQFPGTNFTEYCQGDNYWHRPLTILRCGH